jgi:protein-tyrosine-phosphatase
MLMKKNILVVCDDNTLYSKIAEAYLKKYAGHWKNIFSAGVSIDGKNISSKLLPLLEKEELLPMIDTSLMSVDDYKTSNIDYVIALTQKAYDYSESKLNGKEIVFFPVDVNSLDNIEKISDEIKDNALRFVKNGPIKRWLEK